MLMIHAGRSPIRRNRASSGALIALAIVPCFCAGATLPTSPESYLSQAVRVRHSADRPWLPEAGQLGNLRDLQITAPDCTVRIVSGSENRVFPGKRAVFAIEQSRVLDADPNERPAPRDVLLAVDPAKACPSVGSCGVSTTPVTRAPIVANAGSVCFTVQLSTAHDLLIGGDGLTLLVDHVRQPALRLRVNPSYPIGVWLEQVDLGLLSIDVNAAARIGGNGRVDFLGGSSSSGASVMYLQDFRAPHVGVSTTTTGTRWAIRIDPETKASYYQPARAPGKIAKMYPIEIDGPVERLEVPAGHVDAYALTEAMRGETRALRDQVLRLAGPTPRLPSTDPALPSASVAAASLPADARERVAQVVARHLPASVRITNVALWKRGGRLEGIAPGTMAARDVLPLLANSGEFTYVSGGGSTLRDGGQAFSTQLYFSCDAPGEQSSCPAGDPATPGAYGEAQVRDALAAELAPAVTVRSVRLSGDTVQMTATASNEADARAGLERLGQHGEFMRLSTSSFGPSGNGPLFEISARLQLSCAVPPKAGGICAVQDSH